MGDYKCLHCSGTTIYMSVSPIDLAGTLSCFTCGETADSRGGISFKGRKIEMGIRRAHRPGTHRGRPNEFE
jgi:hypothetical protein